MLMRMKQNSNVLDLRRHSPETVGELRRLLASGVPARPDPHRPNFYELDGGWRVFYIYVSPKTGNVTLLAVWRTERRAESYPQENVTLAACCAPTG